MERKPLKWTKFSDVFGLLLMFSLLFGALTAKMAWFIATVATVPIVVLVMYMIWLKYGDNRLQVNELYSFIATLMTAIYFYIPLFSVIWNTWVGIITILLYVLLFCIFYHYREPLCRMSHGRDPKGKKKEYPFITWWLYGLGILGISSFIFILATVTFPPHEAEIILAMIFSYSCSFMFLTASPLNLVPLERLVEWKLISRRELERRR